MLLLIGFAFLSGIVTILSPCILPVLPIVLSGSVGGKRRPFGIIAGFIISFTVFTLALTALVQFLGIPSDTLRLVAVALIVLFGAVLLIPRLTQIFEVLASRLSGGQRQNRNRKGFTGGLVTGVSLGLIWTPCVGPIMASVITLAITQTIDGGAVIITLAYSLGTSIPMLALMAGGRQLLGRFPALTRNTGKIHRAFGIILILTGLSIGFNLDRKFQTAVLQIFPTYGTGLTFFEDSGAVQNALEVRSGADSLTDNLGPAPEIITTGQWFNSAPLSMKELKGKVVVIDFWTYSCINCVRTIPYLRSWYETYRDDGLVIIGVHSPEFAFERDPENLQKAIKDLGVTWPVVQDNQFFQWKAYNNRYWPAKYFIDKKGNIRYTHFGEGDYKESEEVIRMLLEEEGGSVGSKAPSAKADSNYAQTGETYLGYNRMSGFVSPEEIEKNGYRSYTSPQTYENGQWSLSGNWAFTGEYVVNEGAGELELSFNARDVFLVIDPEEPGNVTVELDGKPEGEITPQSSRHYQVVGLNRAGEHILKLKVEGKMRLYAFTFG